MRQRSGTTGAGQPVKSAGSSAWPPWIELMLSVEARAASGTTGMAVRRAASAGQRLASISASTAAHVPHRAVAEERHRAVGDAPEGLELGPPDPAVAEADAVLVQRLGDDDVRHPLRGGSSRAAPGAPTPP